MNQMSKRSAAVLTGILSVAVACQTSSPELETLPFSPPAPSRTPDQTPTVVAHPTAQVTEGRPTETPWGTRTMGSPTPSLEVTQTAVPRVTRSIRGTASTYGPGYEGLFALPASLGGRGERVRITNVKTGRSLIRTSNDVGPVERLKRVADLDESDFEFLCGCGWRTGLQTVIIEYL